jgi:hypothetical protein
VNSVPLLQPVAGRPYVDVRASANSLLPQALSTDHAEPLADAWQQRLLDQPQLHDRYEFAIAQTCVDFDFDARWRARYAGVLDAAALAHYRTALRAVTVRCLAPATLAAGMARLRRLATPAHGDHDLTAACERLPRDAGIAFALIARLAFVHEALLRSAVARGALRAERLLQLQRRERFDADMHAALGARFASINDWLGYTRPPSAVESSADPIAIDPITIDIDAVLDAAQAAHWQPQRLARLKRWLIAASMDTIPA